ncbi:hypothetical protein [Yersinia aleksiciae]|uniref:hypothetical protein n=1 Tax=Yersinia aleksiciae TaxID=263819 RepID=UPI0005E54525|nr:hypothetical protein [Yersinia aleksiciae]CNI65518.1 Uncharacterised protein [Yersinia frederiksenii]
MLNFAKALALALYGIVGVAGWYQYDNLLKQPIVTKSVDNLSPDLTINYVRSMVWYHSRGKLQELRSILLNDDLSKRDRIEIRLKNMLMHRSSAYIREFNSLNTPVNNLGTWYQDNFNFDSFLHDIYEVVFDAGLTVDEKIRNVTDIMEEYQNITNRALIENLSKTKGVSNGT